jgi:hypothetical protein
MDWQGLVASFAGNPEQPVDAPFGTTKVVVSPQAAWSMTSGVSRFESWCGAHSGRSGRAEQLQASNADVSRFQAALSAKLNADQAMGSGWSPSLALMCVDKGSGKIVAAMLSIQGHPREGFEREGKHFDKLTRVFFDASQVDAFSSYIATKEAERSSRATALSRERLAARDEATGRLRTRPQVGDRTSLGVIVELRPPLALVQYDLRYRAISGRPASEWVRIDGLSAPSD